MSITRAGETFDGYNKPKRTPDHPTKKPRGFSQRGRQGAAHTLWTARRQGSGR